jgi:hypothetical protein
MQALELSGPSQSRIEIDRKHACGNDPDTDADFSRGSRGDTTLPSRAGNWDEVGAGRRTALKLCSSR